MNETRSLQLEFDGGRTVPVQIRRETRERSPHTGRDLMELHGWASTSSAETHAWIAEMLRATGDRPVLGLNEAGEYAGKWCLSWNSYAENDGVHTYTLLLREAEELSLEALLVEGLELHPYEYREEVVGDGLTLRAKMLGSEEDVRRVRALVRSGQPLRVVRRGIQEEEREMRVGTAEWSQVDDRIRYRLVLVDRHLDERPRPELARVDEENGRAALGFYANFLERLSDLMVEKGVLTREELHLLRESARSARGVSRHELWRVADIDEL